MDTIIKEQEDRIVWLTLNRPEKRNALNAELIEALKNHLDMLKQDAHVRVIIIKGNGENFCAGADLAYLQQLQQNTYEENLTDSRKLSDLFRAIQQHPKLIIAQVHGSALAGGCGLATVCDLCYATPDANFGYTEVNIGFIPAIVSYYLLRKTGETRAKELLLTGKWLKGEEAVNYNLITAVFPAESLDEEVVKCATKVAYNTSSSSVAMTKELMAEIFTKSPDEAMILATEKNAEARATDDCKKGIHAFLHKQKIVW